MFKKVISIILLCTTFMTFNKNATILMDMNGVLVHHSGFRLAKQVGFSTFIGFYNPRNIQPHLFSFLHSLQPRNAETPNSKDGSLLVPQIMCDWLMGIRSNQEIQNIIRKNIKNVDHLFKKRYQKIIKSITDVMFNEKKFIKTIKPIKKGIKLLKELYEKGHTIIILSNWDSASFDVMRTTKKFQSIFNHCHDYIISGDIGLMKPDPTIFEYVFDLYNLGEKDQPIIFIDDQIENIQAAQSLNKKQLHCFHCKKEKFKPVKEGLKKLGIL